jgi:hypothetical protein
VAASASTAPTWARSRRVTARAATATLLAAVAKGLQVDRADGRAAVTRAEAVVIPDETPRERTGHHWIDVARANLLVEDTAASLAALEQARRVSPDQVRAHPLARETVYALAHRERRASDTLRGLANWIGIQD